MLKRSVSHGLTSVDVTVRLTGAWLRGDNFRAAQFCFSSLCFTSSDRGDLSIQVRAASWSLLSQMTPTVSPYF